MTTEELETAVFDACLKARRIAQSTCGGDLKLGGSIFELTRLDMIERMLCELKAERSCLGALLGAPFEDLVLILLREYWERVAMDLQKEVDLQKEEGE